jgi:hypothetical protein
MNATDFVEQMWLDHYNSNKTTWWRVRPVGCPVGLSEYQTVVLFVLQKSCVDWLAPLSHAQLQEAESTLAGALEFYDYKP